MEELLQAPTKGYGEAIVILEILAENFEIKTNLLQLVQANKFHGFKKVNPYTHISNFKRMTAILKYRDVLNDAIKLMLFPYSLEGAARIWYEKEPPNSILTWDDLVNKFFNHFFSPSKTTHLKNEISRFSQRFKETFGEACDRFKEMLRACPHHRFSELNQIDTLYNGLTEQDQDSLNAVAGGNLLNKTTREALKIIENKSKVCYSRSKSNVSRVNTNSRDVVSKIDDRIDKLADQISNLVEIINKQVIAPAKAVEKTCVTCGGAHAYYDCIAIDSNPSSVCTATGSYNQVSPPNRASHQILPPGFAPVQNNLNRRNNFQNNQGCRAQMNNALNFQNQGSFFQNQPSTLGTLLSNNVPNPKGEMKVVTTRSGLAYEGPSIPTEPLLEKVDEQNTEEILDKEHSNSSGSTAQVQPSVMPISIPEPDVLWTQTKPTIPYPSRLNDQKLREKATNQMEKFFQIFHDLHFDISFADALLLMAKFASTIKNLLVNKDKLFELAKVPLNENCSAMLLKKLSEKLGDPELTPTQMTLELADRSITRPKGVAEDVIVKVGKFHFPTNFIVVDFKADPRVPLILGRSFLRTGRALIDVYREEITLRVNEESITFNLNQTMRYSSNYDDTFVNRVDVIDIACEEFVQDVLDFQYNSKSSSPTLVSDDSISKSDSCKEPIVKSSSPTLTLFGESDFFLKEIEYFLNDNSIPTRIENSVYDSEEDILFLEKLLNEDPFQLPPMDLKLAKESKEKSFVEEPPELELKEFPCHLEYAFLEDSNKLPKISDIKGIDSRFCTPNILMEDDYKPAVQSQKRVNPKIHDVIKKEVIKLIDSGMIYPISNSPWSSPIHCVPKKGGMTVVANENNELIPTRLVTGWRVCIDYRKLNDATRKDHFPLLFMAQMLERLAGNEFYCFLDGFSGYFQIPIDLQDQEKTTFTCPYGTFTYRRMPFGLCNALEAPILVVPDWNLPFELMCDASDYAIGAVLGQRKSKNLQPIHYARNTMTEAQIHYTTTEKEMLAIVYAFEKFRPYLVLSKSIVYTDHSALKYLLNKQDTKPREGIVLGHKISKSGIEVDRAKVDVITKLPHPTTVKGVRSFLGHAEAPEAPILVVPDWNLPFKLMCDASDYVIGSENLAADHLSRLENPHQDVLENKDINENFPLETLGSLTSHSTSWFADIANFHAGNFIKKGLTSQQKKKFFKDLLKFSKLAMRDLLGAIMVPISQRRSDRGTHFCNDQFTRVMIKYGVTHRLATAYHPQMSGQVKTAGDHCKLQLNELSELRDQAYENSLIYKERTKKLHDSKVKNRIFNVGDQVLLFNSRLKIFSGKLKTRWSGPFTITRVFPYGTIELSQPNGSNFKVNGHRMKDYFDGDIPSNVASDLHKFLM
uniref:Reverse transcriptase domain-containing protein n=1 Tax=Tanacetum cinerariifolium TaxID=118510 RepID=A0A6L2P9I0_TANCI|nr:reverse transcriptase domain-containing protein [Tanacetum cinerariifolium]